MVPIYKGFTSLVFVRSASIFTLHFSLSLSLSRCWPVGCCFLFWFVRGSARSIRWPEYNARGRLHNIYDIQNRHANATSTVQAYAKQRPHRHLINTEWQTEQRKCITATLLKRRHHNSHRTALPDQNSGDTRMPRQPATHTNACERNAYNRKWPSIARMQHALNTNPCSQSIRRPIRHEF